MPRASMKDEQWVSTFGTASGFGQEVEGGFLASTYYQRAIQSQNVVYGALLKIRRIYRVRIDWV